MEVDRSELSKMVEDMLLGLKDGISASGHSLTDPIKIELAVVMTKGAGGKLNFLPVEAGGKYQKEEISKITFSVL